MINTYLNLSVEDMRITSIINTHIKKLKSSSSIDEFKNAILELENIKNSNLSEYDDDLICDKYNVLNKTCQKQLSALITDNTLLPNGYPLGELIISLYYNGY